jgi:hypothetical protein
MNKRCVIVVVRVHTAWWLPVYLNTVAALCRLLNAKPNMDRVSFSGAKAVRCTANKEFKRLLHITWGDGDWPAPNGSRAFLCPL